MMLSGLRCIKPVTESVIKVFSSQSSLKHYCKKQNPENDIEVRGLAKALGKFRELEKIERKEEQKPKEEEQHSFLHLLRNSEFIQMGDPLGKIVIGKIFQVVNTDLYIDFGGKFYCVCRKPKKNSELYVRNARVKLRINELELCAKFLGAVQDLTLTEASGTLLDLVWTPFNSKKEEIKEIKT